jgi:outer membrane protein OmpA-like peptidoglycan-associated protein/ABC-type nitrate/sulfonate/bicarbonate transport system substrate-binding protein
MKTKIAALAALMMAALPIGAQVVTETAKPAEDVLTTKASPVKNGPLTLPVITWGGDVAAILADMEGFDSAEGVDYTLKHEDDALKQAQSVLNGESPFFRGTMAQVLAVQPAFAKAGVPLVVLNQITWSNGGDTVVVRGDLKPADLKGKKIALQLFGPHMDYVGTVLSSAGLSPRDVSFVWMKELTLPKYDTKGKAVDPVSAFSSDSSIAAIAAISPDAAALTSGGKVGTGSEGSVKDARISLSTKTASKVIADVWAVRKDWLDANRDKAQKIVHVLMRGQEALGDMSTQKGAKYQQLLSKSAELLFGTSTMTADVEGMISEAEFVSHAGNVQFFKAIGTLRNFNVLSEEIQTTLIGMGLMRGKTALTHAEWDYAALAAGLKNTDTSALASAKFDSAKLATAIEAESTSWDSGTLFVVEINFDPNQASFDAARYAADYDKALKLASTFGGAVVAVEGHSDPTGIEKAKAAGENPLLVQQKELAAKNLSLNRANAVRASYLEYCKAKGLVVDESQFLATGKGVSSPKFPQPKTRDEWSANRRVVFRVLNVEAEAADFTPSK